VGFTVLIVDDHPTFRKFARRLLEHAGYEVVGEAEDGAAAIEAARALRPMAVLLDVLLPDISGFAVADELAGTLAGGSVVLTS
jgi:CheY-like chemotaxis protein